MTVTNIVEIHAIAQSDYLGAGTNGKSQFDIHWDQAQSVRMFVAFDTEAQAADFAAQFPKSVGWSPNRLHADDRVYGCASLLVKLSKDGVRGEKNETGIRRYRRAMQLLEKFGQDTVWTTPRIVGAYDSREQFEAGL
jgi:hypothetical protein